LRTATFPKADLLIDPKEISISVTVISSPSKSSAKKKKRREEKDYAHRELLWQFSRTMELPAE
jgi:hypothetical protein